MVIWLTGLSGSGKTTLAKALWQALKPHLPEVVLLDGDSIREAFNGDLGYSQEDRRRQIQRLQKMAKLLSDQNLVVIVAAVYSHPDLFSWNRKNLNPYFEVYLEVSLKTLRDRDPKGLYAKAIAGECPHVVGLDIAWNSPRSPDLVINTDQFDPAEKLAQRVIAAIPGLIKRLGKK